MAKATPIKPEEINNENYAEFLASHPNESIRQMWDRVTTFAAPLTEMQEKVRAASPPPVSELDEKLKTSEDPQVIEFRTAIEKLEQSLREAREDAHKYLLKDYKVLSDDELNKLKTEYAKQYEKVKTVYGMLRDYASVMGGDDINTDGVITALDKYRIPNLRGAHNTGSANTEGVVRPRLQSVHVIRPNGQEKTFDRFAAACVWSKMTTQVVYTAWLAAAGATAWQDITEKTTFEIEKHTFTITPQATEE